MDTVDTDPNVVLIAGDAAPVPLPASEPDAPPTVYTVPTREQARAKRDQEQQGFWFRLFRTGGHAHVRLLSLADKATLAGLPLAQQARALEVFNELNKEQGGSGALTIQRLNKNQDRQERLANTLCIAGFVTPRLVASESELDGDPHTWLVTDVHIQERIAYYNLCIGQDQETDSKLIPFSGAATT